MSSIRPLHLWEGWISVLEGMRSPAGRNRVRLAQSRVCRWDTAQHVLVDDMEDTDQAEIWPGKRSAGFIARNYRLMIVPQEKITVTRACLTFTI